MPSEVDVWTAIRLEPAVRPVLPGHAVGKRVSLKDGKQLFRLERREVGHTARTL